MAKKAKDSVKEIKVSKKYVKSIKLTARCMKCKVDVKPNGVKLHIHTKINVKGEPSRRFRISGTCPKSKTVISKMMGKDAALEMIKASK